MSILEFRGPGLCSEMFHGDLSKCWQTGFGANALLIRGSQVPVLSNNGGDGKMIRIAISTVVDSRVIGTGCRFLDTRGQVDRQPPRPSRNVVTVSGIVRN